MLFSRRKAEIEVLSAIKPASSEVVDLGIGGGVDHTRETGDLEIPLLRYLISKIQLACVEPWEILLHDDD